MKRILPSKLLLLIGLNACLGLAYATQSMFDVYFVKNINNDTTYLNVSTKPPNHYYPAAGMQIVDSNYDLSEQNVNCILGGNGWCVFGGSNTATKILLTAHPIGHNPKNIGLPGTEQITLKLALDAQV